MKHSLSHIKTLADAQNILSSKSEQAARVEKVLGLIGRALGVHRVSLFKMDLAATLFKPLCRWNEKGIFKGDDTELLLENLENPDDTAGSIFAQPIHEDSKLSGLLLVETKGIHEPFTHQEAELIRGAALMLAPHLEKEISDPLPSPRLNAPEEENIKPTTPSDESHILIVEDDEANLFMIQKFIERFGAIPHAVRNGQDAIQICKKMKFDVILMDLTMPKLDGFDATREIVTGANLNRSTPIIAVTADVTDGIERRCKKIGMQHYIAKPIRRDTILRVLTDLINKEPKEHK